MENIDLFWLFAFTIQLFVHNLSYHLMSISLKSKPLVKQSIYDQALLDAFLAGDCYGSWNCIVVIASRFSIVRFLILEYPFILTVICSATTLVRVITGVMYCCVCFIRILYLYDMNFVEETLGEKFVRITSLCISLSSALVVLVVSYIKDEMVSGLLVLYTGQEREIIGNDRTHGTIYLL